MNDDSDFSPGWHAIDAALEPLYGDREPLHYGTIVSYAEGGPDPIHGISAYHNLAPVPHWHFVTYGFSELWEKTSRRPEISGWGFELTFRLACPADDETPPSWALNFLQHLGRYVFETGNVFGSGHTMPLNGPIHVGDSTLIHAIAFLQDGQLGSIDTPNGRVEFLQVVGVTLDELEAIESWNAAAFLQLAAETDPRLITDVGRLSWLSDANFAAEVARRTQAEGSSCGWLSLYELSTSVARGQATLRFQTIAASAFCRRLLGRIPFGRELTLAAPDARVVFVPSERVSWEPTENGLRIALTADAARGLAERLRPHHGKYTFPDLPGLTVEVLTTEITNDDGDIVNVVE